MNDSSKVKNYHEQTKHSSDKYAASPGYLDWETQPNPFRTFDGTERVDLPLTADSINVTYDGLFKKGQVMTAMLNLNNVAALLELCLGLAAWKEYGENKWALRCNPSSGNLHPTEGYLITTDIPGLKGGVYHYDSENHALEKRMEPSEEFNKAVHGRIMIGISSIHWREEWKYGERAYRYCQLDVGHAIASIQFAAAVIGWQTAVVTNVADKTVATLMGIDRLEDFGEAETESPDALLLVEPGLGHMSKVRGSQIKTLVEETKKSIWSGKANSLAKAHAHSWPIVSETAEAALKEDTKEKPWAPGFVPTPPSIENKESAANIIRSRRSAQAFDGKTVLSNKAFYRMLSMTIPRQSVPPWGVLPWEPKVHPIIFVHRVEDVEPGLYALPRREGALEAMQSAMRKDFLWAQPEHSPGFPKLYHLATADMQTSAKGISCNQDIASDGAFSVGMLAEFDDAMSEGSFWYRRLFWEAGVLGQVLYLEAEAAGMRGTGIGCYFDDLFHEMLGLEDTTYQSMYHFTIGAPVDDERLTTLPPYQHLKR